MFVLILVADTRPAAAQRCGIVTQDHSDDE
jgi:hypothetical protein